MLIWHWFPPERPPREKLGVQSDLRTYRTGWDLSLGISNPLA